ncbi:hypothetical protein scyTo_0011180, partial [Scyliorhinus torazame]|nr:hypothetical protein [Scyliorhinus torazame]
MGQTSLGAPTVPLWAAVQQKNRREREGARELQRRASPFRDSFTVEKRSQVRFRLG